VRSPKAIDTPPTAILPDLQIPRSPARTRLPGACLYCGEKLAVEQTRCSLCLEAVRRVLTAQA